MTSAPMSARIMVRNGPGKRRERSRTLMPARARARDMGSAWSSGLGGQLEEGLELHGQHGIAADAQLALEVELHARLGIAEHGLEVLVADLDRALRVAAVA